MADILHMRVKMAPPAPASRGKAFDAARQHSRRVRLLRFAVPFVALVGVLGFLGWVFFDPFRGANVEITIKRPDIQGNKIVMELPHLTGFNKQQQAYNVTATTATQLITSPGLIDLAGLQAIISMADQSKATLSSNAGKFDSNAEILHLQDNVRVQSTKGYSAELSVATVNFKAGTVDSDKPVVVRLANGTINGGGLSITKGGSTISFSGGVVSRFQRMPAASPAPEAPSGTQ